MNKQNIRSTGPKVEGLARREYEAGTDRLSSDDACANIQVIVLRRYSTMLVNALSSHTMPFITMTLTITAP